MSQSTPQFSSTYWDLHRNVLLSGLALLILCLPGVEPARDQSFLWVKFTSVSLLYLRIILFIVMLYCSITYLLEWINEALPLIGSNSAERRKLSEIVDNHTISIEQRISPILEDCRLIIDDINKIKPYPDSNGYTSVDDNYYLQYSSLASDGAIAQLNWFADGVANDIEYGVHDRSAIKKAFSEAGREYARMIADASMRILVNSESGISALAKTEKLTSAILLVHEELQHPLRRSFRPEILRYELKTILASSFTARYFRIVMIGAFVPIVLFTTASIMLIRASI